MLPPYRTRLTRCMAATGGHAPSSGKTVLRKNPALYRPTEQRDGREQDSRPSRKPEVLAPAGGWEQLRAAAENGADAVYFGVSDFNARARAENFTVESLPEVTRYLHQRGMKGYLVLNVLAFDEELGSLAHVAQAARRAGVDAVIVQDIGAVDLITAVAPGLPIHGSTQMTVTSADGMEYARHRGMERVVVGRELSVEDIADIARNTEVEIETFVHGALCVSYSGQCFSSEAWGGRSANRGQCAQACRLPYGLIVDGQLKRLVDSSYVLSPQDLSAVDLVPQLIEAGVVSLKIEGRLKGPEYVAMTTRVYRNAVDAAWSALEAGRAVAADELIDEQARDDLRCVFSRAQDADHDGLTHGFLDGSRHQTLVRGRQPRHRGLYIGQVIGVDRKQNRQRLEVQLVRSVKLGDGLVVDQGKPEEVEVGGSVFSIHERGEKRKTAQGGSVVSIELGSGSGRDVDVSSVLPGNLVFKNKDDALMSRLRSSFESVSAKARRRSRVEVDVDGAIGQPLAIHVRRAGDKEQNTKRFTAVTESAVETAASRPTSRDDLRKAIGLHLGDEGSLVLGSFQLHGPDPDVEGFFVPMKEVKEARRRAVQAMLLDEERPTEVELPDASAVVDALYAEVRGEPSSSSTSSTASSRAENKSGPSMPRIRVLCRTPEQVAGAASVDWLEEIVLDFLEAKGLAKAIALVKAAGKRAVVALPRILKPQEKHLWEFYIKLGTPLLLRSAGMIQRFADLGGPGATVVDDEGKHVGIVPHLEGDFSLNATNAVSAKLLLDQGLDSLALTYDCNSAQITHVLDRLGPLSRSKIEVIIHSNLPIFHTEHCLFARFLSDGDDYRTCGRPCETTTLHIRDSTGRDHRVEADMGCRNTVFEASSQTALRYLQDFRNAGAGLFRVELVDQPATIIPVLLSGIRDVLAAETETESRQRSRDLFDWMDASLTDANGRCHGVNEGSLEVKAENRHAMRPTASALRKAGRRERDD